MSACTAGVAVAVSASTGAPFRSPFPDPCLPSAQRRQPLPQHPVIRPEVMPPLRNAVRLINGNQRQRPLRQHLRKSRHPQPLRRNKQELQRPLQIIHARLPRHAPLQPGMDPRHLAAPAPPASPPGLPSAQSAAKSPAPCLRAQSPAVGSTGFSPLPSASPAADPALQSRPGKPPPGSP